MQLIHSIEINYFRSAYSIKLKFLSDLNVIVGGNDCGKSNILRAINLFFQNKPSPNEQFKFLDDVNHYRQGEAQSAKGRLSLWIKVHFNNILGWKSLPERFSVKRSWNRYSNEPETTYSSELDSAVVTRFLNKIKLHYVPAVRHPETYKHYVRELYESISADGDADLTTPADALSGTINNAVAELTDSIQSEIGVTSAIQVPTDFGALIETLTFVTNENGNEISLDRRGDGIQSRHIPHILNYISQRNKKLNIWIYEEPENSLEMKNSYLVARQFLQNFSRDNQVFVSSHSPAFYGLSGDGVAKFFAKKSAKLGRELDTECAFIQQIEDVDQQLGIAALIQAKSADLFRQIEELSEINEKLAQATRPVIITEGVTDVAILEEAASRFSGRENAYNFQSCEEQPGIGGGHGKLRSLLESVPFRDHGVRIGIFDNDEAGRKSFNNLKGFDQDDLFANLKRRRIGNVFAIMLPDVDWGVEYWDHSGRQVAIEQLFSPEIVGHDIIEKKYEIAKGFISADEFASLASSLGEQDLMRLVRIRISISDKNKAVQRICASDNGAFTNVGDLFDQVDAAIATCS